MPEIIWLDEIETDNVRIGIDNWGGLYIKTQNGETVALDPNVVGKIINARKEIA